MQFLRTVFGSLRHVINAVFFNALVRFKLEQLLRDGGDQAGGSDQSRDAQLTSLPTETDDTLTA